jgi:hypothetical protein
MNNKEQLWALIQELTNAEDSMRAALAIRMRVNPGGDYRDLIDQIERTHQEVIALTNRYYEEMK